jgi:hypothetical protein
VSQQIHDPNAPIAAWQGREEDHSEIHWRTPGIRFYVFGARTSRFSNRPPEKKSEPSKEGADKPVQPTVAHVLYGNYNDGEWKRGFMAVLILVGLVCFGLGVVVGTCIVAKGLCEIDEGLAELEKRERERGFLTEEEQEQRKVMLRAKGGA